MTQHDLIVALEPAGHPVTALRQVHRLLPHNQFAIRGQLRHASLQTHDECRVTTRGFLSRPLVTNPLLTRPALTPNPYPLTPERDLLNSRQLPSREPSWISR